MTSQQGPDTSPIPPYQYQPPPPRQPWGWKKILLVTLGSVFGFILVIGVIGAAFGAGKPAAPPAHHNAPAAVLATSSPSATVTTTPAAVATTTQPSPQPTTQAPAPVQTTQAAPPPAGCHPLTPSGNCYEPGEYCPTADAGITGLAGDGETIVCELESGRYHWHPTN